MKTVLAALSFFLPDCRIDEVVPLAGGNVNDSCCVHLQAGDRYLLQKLNSAVFPEPRRVIDNLLTVTTHLQREQEKQAGCQLRIPRLILSPGGEPVFVDDDGCCWRLLSWIGDSRSLSVINSPEQGWEVGRLLACFHQLTANLSAKELHITLPDFHHTPSYLAQYDRISRHKRKLDSRERQGNAFIEKFRCRADILEKSRCCLRSSVIHGDPKVGNFLFAADSNKAISLIDLDTVMPGLLLHDIGDCLRSCCNPAGEEPDRPDEVVFDGSIFTGVVGGYCEQALDLLAEEDRRLLLDAVFVISFELGLRFFTDHLAGNTYFKIQRPGQNLQRALTQFYLAASIDRQRPTLDLLWEQSIMAVNTHTR